jgi:hypothetical protein
VEEEKRMSEAPKVLEQMMAMWNERDLEKVRGYIDEIFSEDVLFIDPGNSIVGHDAFEVMVRAFRTRFPDADLSHSSGFDQHHGLVRYHWKIHQNAEFLIEGFDVTEIGSDGRVSRVEGFFGAIPES